MHKGGDWVIVPDDEIVGVLGVASTEVLLALVVGPEVWPDTGVAPMIPVDSRTATV